MELQSVNIPSALPAGEISPVSAAVNAPAPGRIDLRPRFPAFPAAPEMTGAVLHNLTITSTLREMLTAFTRLAEYLDRIGESLLPPPAVVELSTSGPSRLLTIDQLAALKLPPSWLHDQSTPFTTAAESLFNFAGVHTRAADLLAEFSKRFSTSVLPAGPGLNEGFQNSAAQPLPGSAPWVAQHRSTSPAFSRPVPSSPQQPVPYADRKRPAEKKPPRRKILLELLKKTAKTLRGLQSGLNRVIGDWS